MCHLTLRSRAGSKSPPKKHPKKASGKSRHTSPPLRSQLLPGFPLMLSTLERVWSPLSQLSVGRDRAVLKSIWSESKELCLCFWNSASFYQSRCFFQRELLSPREIPVCQYQLWNSNWMQCSDTWEQAGWLFQTKPFQPSWLKELK